LVSRAQDTTSDVIAARKLLMDSIMNNMDKIQEMISERRIDPSVSRECADNSPRCSGLPTFVSAGNRTNGKKMSTSIR